MLRLSDRSRQIPGGLRFLQSETKWQATPWSSFSTLVDALIAHRRANPYLAKKNNWKLDRREVEDEVDAYNSAICQAHGWTQYVTDFGGVPDPKLQRPHSPPFGGAVVAGAKTLVEMFGPKGPIKDVNVANERAVICIACPKHDKGDWKRFFTQPAQAFVMKMLGVVKDLELKTDYDDLLHVCSACYCPMRGKIWTRAEHILAHIPPADKAALDSNCWILAEEAKAKHAAP